MVSASYPDGPGIDTPIPPPAESSRPRRLTPSEQDTLEASIHRWHAAGAVVHPVCPDGSKKLVSIRGAGVDGRWGWGKIARGEFPPLTAAQVVSYVRSGRTDGIAVILGPVSGNLEMVEVEGRARDLLPRLRDAAERRGVLPLLERLAAGLTEESPSAGLHWFLRVVDGDTTNGLKLASRPVDGPTKQLTLAETKGQGGIAVVFGSGGRTHKSGKPYQLLRGGPETIPSFTVAERDALYAAFQDLDEMPAPPAAITPARLPPVRPRAAGEVSVADDYAQRTTWEDLLVPAGWTPGRRSGDRCEWCRPGKKSGLSATTKGAVLYSFTTSSVLPSRQGLTKFAVYAHLHHGGDLHDAARELARLGYGSRGDDQDGGGSPAVLERPPLPDGPVRSLDEYRDELRDNVAGAVATPGLHLVRAATGTGKSTAVARALLGVRSSLTVLPTHDNVRERVQELRDAGVDAVAYPEPDDTNCAQLEQFVRVQRMGLVPGAVLCPSCPFKDDCPYRAGVKRANDAHHRVGTHERLRRSSVAAKDAQVVVVDETPELVIAPTLAIRAEVLVQVGNLAREIVDLWYSPATDDQKAFAATMRLVVDAVNESCRGITGPGRTRVILPAITDVPENWQRVVWRMVTKVGTRDLDPDALQLVTRAAAGELHHLEVVTDRTERWGGGEDGTPVLVSTLHHYVVASWRPSIPADAAVILLDGTAVAEDVAAVAGVPVTDRTPAGRIERSHPVLQVNDDITRGTSSRRVAGVVDAFLVAHPEVQRLGVIGHQLHVRELIGTDESPGLLGPHLGRIAKSCWFGAGPDRASNDWHASCDHILVLGTPRVNPGDHRRWLIAHGLDAAAQRADGDWGPRPWIGTTPDGGTTIVARDAYRDPDWDRAFRATTTAALVQSLGRGRSLLEGGIPVTLVTNEPLGLPILPAVEGTAAAVLEVVGIAQDLLADQDRSARSPIEGPYRGNCASRIATAEVVRVLQERDGIVLRTAQLRIAAAVEAGRLRRVGRGWLELAGDAPTVPQDAPPALPPAVAPLPATEAAVVAVVAPAQVPVATITTDTSSAVPPIPPDLLELVEERAAIMEFDGGLTREDADRRARELVPSTLPMVSAGDENTGENRSPLAGSAYVQDAQVLVGVDPAVVAARSIPAVAAVLERFPGVVRRVIPAPLVRRPDPRPVDPRDRSRCRCGCTETVEVVIHGGQSTRHDCARCDRFRFFADWYSRPTPPPAMPPRAEVDVQLVRRRERVVVPLPFGAGGGAPFATTGPVVPLPATGGW
jgi:hypothetical protein